MDVLIKGEIVLFGTVGAKLLPDEEFFTDIDVKNALAKVGTRDISVRINSGGGYADHGVAIYNMLKDHPGKVNVTIDGVAASAGSLIAMAGDTITMNTGTLMMVHRASMVSIGNVDDHEKNLESLKATDNNMVDIYTARTGRARAEIEAEVTAEMATGGRAATRCMDASKSHRAAGLARRQGSGDDHRREQPDLGLE
ncbi:Clp protease ClpP [Mesorhizobium sp. M00.F.Ca.ET.151.01.1.1]|nr:Clp protease ClpP [Mesorhizobium sp. M00.F.Ca.ET.151.01.1.1]